ncbi:hypothetical protein QAD02_014130 [Eretmocerus hayati]|uniref:Uncharacterized protein n=1 Tax=Eretmocerus hayati TaxID=131215 RepID=A0ACC2P5F2_9HYME|nr:hypothetical protein QAD02_014130 [Eretmocerus hayati]
MNRSKKNSFHYRKDHQILLCQLVEQRPILWDATLDSYRRANLKKPLWNEIARILGSVQENAGDQVSQRSKTIKETYSENNRKVNDSKRSGCGTEDVYKPKWFLRPHVQFLKKVCDMGESVCNIPHPTIQSHVPDNS